MRIRLWTCVLALALAGSGPASPRPPDSLGSAPDTPAPLPSRPRGPAPLDELPGEHWVRPLLSRLRFPDGQPPTAPGRSRLDAAVLLARWLERGDPSPGARPRIVASYLGPELATLGFSRPRTRAALDRLAPPADVPVPDDSPGRASAVRRQLTRSLEAHRALEARLEALRARTRGTTP